MLRFKWLHKVQDNPTFRFMLPVMLENIFSIFISMAFSRIISGISGSALAAIGMANTIMNVIYGAFAVVITGGAVLISRHIGAGDRKQAASTTGQAITFAAVSSLAVTLLCIVTSRWVLRLLMPTAEDALFDEAVRYYCFLMGSLPFHVLIGVLGGAMRAMGNSRMPMIVGVITCGLLWVFGWIFVVLIPLVEIGAGLAYICCRVVGTGIALYALMHDHRYFTLRIKDLLHFDLSIIRRIMNIGLPVAAETVFCSLGYMLANSMSIALGTMEASTYQIMNTLNGFIGLPQSICNVVALSVVGRLIGAQDFKGARKNGRTIWLVGLGANIVLGTIITVFATPLSGIYSADPDVIALSSKLMWILIVMGLPAVSINAIDAQLRAGGDVKYVMMSTMTGVWLIRLPLTYLFCFVWDLGVLGIYGANTIALYYRAALGLLRHRTDKWLTKKV